MASFLAVSWITVFVAAVPALYDLGKWWPRCVRTLNTWPGKLEDVYLGLSQQNERLQDEKKPRPVFVNNCKLFLGPLCDLQVITGIGIVVSGFSQIKTISYYHEQLVITYWWTTLNSFWAARVDYMEEDQEIDSVRLLSRRVSILVSCILGVSFQAYINVREQRGWENDGDGLCYRYLDDASSWPFVAGTSIYCLALAASAISTCTGGPILLKLYCDETQNWQDNAADWFREWCRVPMLTANDPSPIAHLQKRRRTAFGYFMILLTGGWMITIWLVFQILSVWSFGHGFYPLFFAFYVLFGAWNTFDIISLKVLNQSLLEDGDLEMTFGQVLALVLIGAIAFNGVDIFRRRELSDEGDNDDFEMRLIL